MLQIAKPSVTAMNDRRLKEHNLADTFGFVTKIARRHLVVIVLATAAFLIAGAVYLMATPSMYTAYASMIIDTRKVQLFQQQSVLGDIPVVDVGTVQTELELLRSDTVSLSVIKDLDLIHDPEFVPASSGPIGAAIDSVKHLFSTQEAPTEQQLVGRALGIFKSHESAARNGVTYVISIGFTSLDPAKSARIADAIANAYINDQLDSKFQATRRASLWLQSRLGELKVQASDADRAVVDFKQKNNIYTIDSTGNLMSDKQLTEVSKQLIDAHAATAEAKARFDRISKITDVKEGLPDASVADALKNEVIIKLRSQFLELQSREAIWAQKYGYDHLATANLRSQMQEVRRSIADELSKIGQGYKSDYDIAVARETALHESMASSVSQSNLSSKAQIQLKELESTSQSYRLIYDKFLQRYTEAIQQESFPITEARLISPASVPSYRSSPRASLILGGALLLGLATSFGYACLREFSERVFRSSGQIEDKLRLNCLTVLPALKGDRRLNSSVAGDATTRSIGKLQGLWRHVLDEPFSQYSEGLRSIKVAADLAETSKVNKVIGFTSTLPNEGKSLMSANFAEMIAHAGSRVLLVDADLRNPSMTRALAPGATKGLVDLINDAATVAEVVWKDPVSGVFFMPGSGSERLIHTSEVLGSERTKALFAKLREQFDYVIVDLAPLAPVVDTRTTSTYIDNFVYVVEWSRTRAEVVEQVLNESQEIYNQILGVVLNKADMGVIGRYELHRSRQYYKNYYGAYHQAA